MNMDYLDFEDNEADRCGLSDIEITIVNGNPPDWWTRSSNWPPPNGSMSLMTRLRVNYKNLPEALKTDLRSDYPDSSNGPILRVGPPLHFGITGAYAVENDSMLYRSFPASDIESCTQCPVENTDQVVTGLRNRIVNNILTNSQNEVNFYVSSVNSQVQIPNPQDDQQDPVDVTPAKEPERLSARCDCEQHSDGKNGQ
ncbi:uncharacterized protein LOC129590198 [Paramacrobiotus metropolitanus]|uniref:uncharacterized protein LOC129590198 n=1 Tax=Paramacrobiotus metropolitanus TaxID=2943436 RepID=UPI002445EEB3|nr:uncharacterized protein LOC129590198 [Paramacrobiotus metropolitanus]